MPHCGKPTIAGFTYCPFCGEPVQPDEPINLVEEVPDEESLEDATFEEVNEPISDEAKPSFKDKVFDLFKNARFLTIFKHSILVVFCAIMFVLSFCPIYKYSYFGYSRYQYDEVELLPTDFISLLPAISRNYDEEKDEKKLDRLYEELFENDEELFENGDVIRKSDYDGIYARYFKQQFMNDLEYTLSKEGNASMKSVYAFTAVTCLINVIFSSIILALSVVFLVFAIVKKDSKINCTKLFPLYLFMELAVLYSSTSLLLIFDLAGGIIVSLLFACIAIVVSLASHAIQLKKDGKIKLIIPQTIVTILSVVIAGCCFAPSLIGELNVDADDYYNTLRLPIRNDFATSLIFDDSRVEEYDELLEGKNAYDYFSGKAASCTSGLIGYNGYYGETTYGSSIDSYLYLFNPTYSYEYENVVEYAMLAQVDYPVVGALSIGYYLTPISIILLGVFAALATKRNKARGTIPVFVIVLLCATLICSAILCSKTNDVLQDVDMDEIFSVHIGAGIITSLVFTFVLLAFNGINKEQWWLKKWKLSKK